MPLCQNPQCVADAVIEIADEEGGHGDIVSMINQFKRLAAGAASKAIVPQLPKAVPAAWPEAQAHWKL